MDDQMIIECIDACIDQELKTKMNISINYTKEHQMNLLMSKSNLFDDFKCLSNSVLLNNMFESVEEIDKQIIEQIEIGLNLKQHNLKHVILFCENYRDMIKQKKYNIEILRKYLSKYIEYVIFWDLHIIEDFTKSLIEFDIANLHIILKMDMDCAFREILASKHMLRHARKIMDFKGRFKVMTNYNRNIMYLDDKIIYNVIYQCTENTIDNHINCIYGNINCIYGHDYYTCCHPSISYKNTINICLFNRLLETFHLYNIQLLTLSSRNYLDFPLYENSFQYLQHLRNLDLSSCNDMSVKMISVIVNLPYLHTLHINDTLHEVCNIDPFIQWGASENNTLFICSCSGIYTQQQRHIMRHDNYALKRVSLPISKTYGTCKACSLDLYCPLQNVHKIKSNTRRVTKFK